MNCYGMHPEYIKAELRLRKVTPAKIARDLGLAYSTVSHVIHGRGVSAKIRGHIAGILGVAVLDLWPVEAPHGVAADGRMARKKPLQA